MISKLDEAEGREGLEDGFWGGGGVKLMGEEKKKG